MWEVRSSNQGQALNPSSLSFLSHSFSPWMPDLLANEVMQRGRHHGLTQWKKGRIADLKGLYLLQCWFIKIIAVQNNDDALINKRAPLRGAKH